MKCTKLNQLLIASAVAMMLGSCSANDELLTNDVESGTVTINVNLAVTDGGTRNAKSSAADYLVNTPTYLGDEYIDVLYYQVFDMTDANNPKALYDEPLVAENFSNQSSTPISLQIPSTGSFNIVFWAQHKFTDDEIAKGETDPYTRGNLNEVTVNYDAIGKNNNEKVAAFFATTGNLNSAIASTRDIYLRRAVAQVNVGMSKKGYEDMKADYKPAYSKATFTGLHDKFNLLTSTTSYSDNRNANSKTVFTLSQNIAAQYYALTETDDYKNSTAEKQATVKKQHMLTTALSHNDNTNTTDKSATETDYAWVSMCYVLAPGEQYSIPSAEFTFHATNDETSYKQVVRATNVPITANYRTNIISTLTGTVICNVQTAFKWNGNQSYILKLTGAEFAALKASEGLSYVDWSDYDVIIDLSDAKDVGVVAPNGVKSGDGSNNDEPLKILANSITLQNGIINHGDVHFVTTGVTKISNVKFKGDAGNYGTRIMVGDGTFDSDHTGDQYSPEIVIDNVDFTDQTADGTQVCITIDGGITTPISELADADGGTYKLTISNCKFANFTRYAIEIAGMQNNGVADIGNCDFVIPAGNATEPGRGIELFNDNGSTGVSVEIHAVTFKLKDGETISTYATERWGLVGLSFMENSTASNGDYGWDLTSWNIKFTNINGTTTEGTALTQLGIGTDKSLLGLQSGYKTTQFPQSVYLNDQSVSIPFSSYSTGYFKN